MISTRIKKIQFGNFYCIMCGLGFVTMKVSLKIFDIMRVDEEENGG